MSVLQRLAGAPAGDPALSEAVLKRLGWHWECMGCPGGGMWKDPDQGLHCVDLPAVSERAEAARQLVPQDLQVSATAGPGDRWEVRLSRDASDAEAEPVTVAVGATLALALCAAVVKLART